MEDFGSGSQLGRPGQPSEIAPTYVFLASRESELYCEFPTPFCRPRVPKTVANI